MLRGAYKGTRRQHNMKFRQIGQTTSEYGQWYFPKTINVGNWLAFAEAPSWPVFRSNFRKKLACIMHLCWTALVLQILTTV